MKNQTMIGIGVFAVALAAVFAIANENQPRHRDPKDPECVTNLSDWKRFTAVKALPNDRDPSLVLFAAEMCGYVPSPEERALSKMPR